MAGTPESKVKAMVRRWLQKRYPDAFYFLPVSAGYGKHGIPDFVCCIDGRFVGIECKAPGKHPTELQKLRLEEIARAGGVACVVREEQDLEQLGYNLLTSEDYGVYFDDCRS